jgi:hypothetical protein
MGAVDIIVTVGLFVVALVSVYTLYSIKKETDKQYKEWKQKN